MNEETKIANLVRRVADLGEERDEWQRLASAYSPAKELAASLKQAKAAGDAARKECDELRARLPVKREPVRLSDEEIDAARETLFDVGNPYCPCSSKAMTKVARWAERAVLAANGLTT